MSGLEAAGIQTVADQTMTQKDTDVRAQLTEIQKANPDIFVISSFPGQVATIYLQAQELGFKPQLLSVDGTAGPDILSQAGTAMQCLDYTAVWSSLSQDGRNPAFVQAFKTKFGKDPSTFNAAGYDSMWLMATAFKNAGAADKVAVRDALKNITDFKGAMGVYGFGSSRDASVKGTPVQIVDAKPVLWTPQTTCKP